MTFSTVSPPEKTKAIEGDGACFFQVLSHIVTGSEEHHLELHAAICHDIAGCDNVLNPQTGKQERGAEYLARTKACKARTWATTDEVLAVACVLNVVTWARYGRQGHQWLPHGDGANVNVYLDNRNSNPFEVV